jgi:streptogramin lyase
VLALALALLALVKVMDRFGKATATSNGLACSRTYTLDADFDEGTLVNVNHDAPNNNQLQLNQVTEPFPFVNIACSARGTAVRIDVNTGAILGEYLTAPNGRFRNPSRTTVDQLGNVWVSNRDESDGGKGSVARIGLVIGGTRSNADGTPNPVGQYLKPSFQYNTCVDRDNDGLIKTSRGLGNILTWPNGGGVDNNGGVSTAEDECLINYTRVNGTNTRTVAVDANNDLWTGGINNAHEKLSGVTGLPIGGTQFNLGCGGYGGLIDSNNVLWSARFGNNLLRYNATTNTGVCLDTSHGDYGLGIDPTTGEIWHTTLGSNSVKKLNSAGGVLGSFSHGNFYAQGVAVDGSGNVWVAHSLIGPATTVGHLRTNGTYVGNVALPGGSGPTGVAIDANGKVWVANIYSNNAQRIDPSGGPVGGGGFNVGAVDLTVDLGAGAGPYNYSDMTGFVAIGATAPSGTWTVTHDSNAAGTNWGKISWNGSAPAGTNIKVEARAADTQIGLAGQTFKEVANGTSFCGMGVTGRFIEIRTTLSRNIGVNDTPILFDLTVMCCNQPPVAKCKDVTVSAGANCMASASIDDGSFDPDGDAITVVATPPGPYPIGMTNVTLTVTDSNGASSTCMAKVTVVDNTAPTLSCSVAITSLWPANHDLINVGLAASASDNCTANQSVSVQVFADEDDEEATGDGVHSPDAKDIAAGTLRLRSERKGDSDGRVYLIIVTATDAAGNVSRCCRTVVVPHSQSPASISSVNAQAAAALAYCNLNGAAPPGFFPVGDGAVIGPKQ